jgi:hypothetical protein
MVTAPAAVPACGVRITLRFSNKSAKAARAPLLSVPATGCAGTNLERRAPRKRCAQAMTSRLVLPASVITAWAGRCGAMALITAGIWPTGVARSTRSASRTACAGFRDASSITFSLNASARLLCVRPTPTTRRTARARLSASANDPPISPTPITTSFPIFSLPAIF